MPRDLVPLPIRNIPFVANADVVNKLAPSARPRIFLDDWSITPPDKVIIIF
jgi:hypothetical protein